MPARGFSSVQDAVNAIGRGEVIIVMDAEDRENEGDFICAAEKASTENLNLLMSGRGIPCLSLLPEDSDRLQLRPVVETNTAPLKTAYLTPIDHARVRTGITAEERSLTIRTAVDPAATANDFVRPGHVLTLLAKEGGVLRRAGHTEAAVDLARMAGLAPAGVLCEVLNAAGDRATRDELLHIAAEKQMEIITIESLIEFRRRSERLVRRDAEADLQTVYGKFRIIVYEVKYESQRPIVLVMGDPQESQTAPLVRMHSSCFTGDLISSLRCDCGDQLRMALETHQPGWTRRPGVLASRGPRHRFDAENSRVRSAGSRHGHRGSQPGARLPGRHARLRRRHSDLEGPWPARHPPADQQPQEDRRLQPPRV